MSEEPKRGRVTALRRPPLQPNADCVECLRKVLTRAEVGEVVECVIVWVEHDGTCTSDRTAIEYANSVIGELQMAADEISDTYRNDE